MKVQIMRIEDLFATAQQVESGAADRYLEYARTSDPINPEIAALFRRLAEEERKHEKTVLDLAADASIDPANGVAAGHVTPAGETHHFKHTGDTLYSILATAVRREEQAFKIYSQIAASNIDDDVRRYAEIMAKEELGHAALLRAVRRRVYPEHREKTKRKSLTGPVQISGIGEFIFNAYKLESSLASELRKMHAAGEDMSACIKLSDSIIQQLQKDLDDSYSIDDRENNIADDTSVSPESLLHEYDTAYEYYDGFVLQTGNEKIMKTALFLASQALVQLNLIHSLLHDEAVA